jgi:ATP-binding cassette subfamily F protein 3
MVREHLGGIYDYLRTKNAQTISEAIDSPLPPLFDRGEQSATTKSKGNTSPLSKRGAGGESRKADKEGVSYAERKAEQKKNNRIEKRRKELEQKIEELEKRKAELDTLLMQPENAANMQMVNDYTALQAELDKLEEEYFSL